MKEQLFDLLPGPSETDDNTEYADKLEEGEMETLQKAGILNKEGFPTKKDPRNHIVFVNDEQAGEYLVYNGSSMID